jgi:hypothetical protein
VKQIRAEVDVSLGRKDFTNCRTGGCVSGAQGLHELPYRQILSRGPHEYLWGSKNILLSTHESTMHLKGHSARPDESWPTHYIHIST